MALEDEEISFVDKPRYDVKCPVCLEVLEDAYQTPCCGSHICSQCTKELKKCPFCRSSQYCATPDKFFSRQIQSLQVECFHSKRGCAWTGELRTLKQHVEENCAKNFAKCKHCSFRCAHKAFPQHKQVCTDTPQPCPNRCPLKSVKRKDLKRHLEQECSLRVVHGGGPVPHTANQSVQVAPLALTMTNYSQHLERCDTWYSPPFYTHENGYKVHLRVDANWNQKGYVSVLLCVLKGEHDHKLAWPLHANFEVALYNWRTNQPLFSKVLRLPGDAFCSRSTNDLPAHWGKGEVEYISLASIPYDSAKNTEYVQHNCLNFQVNRVTLLRAPALPNLPLWAGDNCFIVPYFSSLKQNSVIFYGSPFYTHQRGYRLCPRVDPNGFGGGKGSHVSVSCTLMKGEYDDNLPWPISADVTIRMLNWVENRNHKSYTVSLNGGANIKTISKVPRNGIAEMCWGSPTFAAHSSLNGQYLNGNCLLFKIDSFVAYLDNASVAKLPPWVNPAEGSPYPCFTLPSFAKRKAFGNIYYSKPFYSHHNGYKMQLCIHAAKGNSVGVFVYLMKGPNDAQLQWPFHSDVVLELVNWQGDQGHHRKLLSFSFKCTNTACDRVTDGDRGTSWGFENFISHTSLPLNPETGIEYLQKDCLHFRVKEVVVHSIATLYKRPMWQNQIPPYQFTVNTFSKRKSLGSEYYGPVFYTHRGGYKMRINVWSENEDIAVYAQLLKGENDARLGWPLRANVVVELLNWRQDANHHSHNIGFHERVPTDNATVEGSWGTGSFISHNSLHSTNTEYLQNDCLCIRVKMVKAYSHSRKVPSWQPQNAPANFTISDVTQRIQVNNEYYSSSFTAAGYKMCLKVHLGRSEKFRGYVSMYACLLKGDDDDTLEWPFCGDIKVEVLNWHGDHGHYKNILPFCYPDDDTHARVMNDEVSPNFYGKNQFMPISTLTSKYLQDDCMRVRVTGVSVYSTKLRFKTPRWQGGWMNSFSGPMEFTLTGFSNRLANGTTCYSPPFYTHPKGYKLKLKIKPEETKRHLSIYAQLLAGEYDESLKWPMNVSVTVEMVNWISNKFHIVKVIRFGEADLKYRRRVPEEEEEATDAWGFEKFCSRDKLLGGPRNIQFVEEDCIRIRVKGVLDLSPKGLLDYIPGL